VTRPRTAGIRRPSPSQASDSVGGTDEDEARIYVPLLYVPFGSEAAEEMAARTQVGSSSEGGGGSSASNLAQTLPQPAVEPTPAGRRPRTAPSTAVGRRGGAPRPGLGGEGALSSAQLGVTGSSGAGAATADPERSLERARRRLCEGSRGGGPMPTWEFEEMEEQRVRPVGGRHTSAGGRRGIGAESGDVPAGRGTAKGPEALRRSVSAGRLRGPASGSVAQLRADPAWGRRSASTQQVPWMQIQSLPSLAS